MRANFSLTILIAGWLSFPDVAAGQAPRLTGLGTLEYRVTTRADEAQQFFNQGLRLLYAFNHAEALRAFREAARLDPQLAMAYWGEALTLGPNLNAPMPAGNIQPAYAAIRRARAAAAAATPRERDLIAALATRYSSRPIADRKALDQKYAAAMADLARRYPDDPEVQVVYVDAVMNTIPWNYWNTDGSFKKEATGIIAALERVIAAHPNHPGAHHYYVHLVEGSNTPERAEASADRLGTLMPAAGHLVHMPAHIYLRVGRYADAAEANERAIRADEDYLAQCQAQGLYPVSYYPHNLHFLWAAATFEGRSAVAIDAARRVADKVPHHHAGALAWTADFPVTPLLSLARFGRWTEVLTTPTPPEREPYAIGIWRYARALAFTANDRLDRADAELAELRRVMAHPAFKTTLKDLPLLTNLQIALQIVAGELSGRRGHWSEAVRALEEAVSIEDAIPYNEPPVWHHPPRQILGALLLEAGRPAEAERAYRADLERFRENGWSLFGLMKSLEAQNRAADAGAVRQRFEKAWARADITLTSSRIMTPRLSSGATTSVVRNVTLPNSVTLEYLETGNREGTPVVFLHGLADSWRSFKDVMPYLASSIRPIALTLRGHGNSSRPSSGYALTDMSSDVKLFLDALGIPAAVIVGHSMGSAVAQHFAIAHPRRTLGLVLMGASPAFGDSRPVQELWDAVSQLSDPISRPFIEEFQGSTLARPIPRPFLDMVIAESGKVPAFVWRAALAGLREGSALEDLHRIGAPTLIAWGDRDTIVSARDQQVLNAGIRGSQLLVYRDAGHGFHWEDPARFAADLEKFVSGLRTRS